MAQTIAAGRQVNDSYPPHQLARYPLAIDPRVGDVIQTNEYAYIVLFVLTFKIFS
jgi:hypothetical protein